MPLDLRRLGSGAKGTRTPDPLLAKQVLFQLSYSPFGRCRPASVGLWRLVRPRVPNRARASTGTRRMAHQAAQTHRYGTDPARQPIVPGGTPTSAITPSVRGANRTIRALRLLDGKSELGGPVPFAGMTYAWAKASLAVSKRCPSPKAARSAHRPNPLGGGG